MTANLIGMGHAGRALSERRSLIGGSDARIIMGDDERALLRLWQEKRGEIEPRDLSGNLVVQLGLVTEELNRRWYEANTGQMVTDVQRHIRHPVLRWMAATLDGRIAATEAVFEAKFMLPWSFSEEGAALKYLPQLQHNMWVVAARTAVLVSGSKSLPMPTRSTSTSSSRPSASFGAVWRAAPPNLFGVEPPKPRIEAVRIVDMSTSNVWVEFADHLHPHSGRPISSIKGPRVS